MKRTELLENVSYTPLVYGRINKKLGTTYSNDELEALVSAIIADPQTTIQKQGKNVYLNNETKQVRLTINRNNLRVITADPFDAANLTPESTPAKQVKKSDWYQRGEGPVSHLVYLNKEAGELPKLLSGEKTMVIRGAAGRKSPLGGRAQAGDAVYFVETGGDLLVSYCGRIKQVVESEKMTPEESVAFVETYQPQLRLTDKQQERWIGKKFLAVYEIEDIRKIDSFLYHREKNMDDWIITDDIRKLQKKN